MSSPCIQLKKVTFSALFLVVATISVYFLIFFRRNSWTSLKLFPTYNPLTVKTQVVYEEPVAMAPASLFLHSDTAYATSFPHEHTWVLTSVRSLQPMLQWSRLLTFCWGGVGLPPLSAHLSWFQRLQISWATPPGAKPSLLPQNFLIQNKNSDTPKSQLRIYGFYSFSLCEGNRINSH